MINEHKPPKLGKWVRRYDASLVFVVLFFHAYEVKLEGLSACFCVPVYHDILLRTSTFFFYDLAIGVSREIRAYS